MAKIVDRTLSRTHAHQLFPHNAKEITNLAIIKRNIER